MSENQGNKFLKFLKSNVYYILVVLALAIMVTVIALTSSANAQNVNTDVDDDKGGSTGVVTPGVEDFRVPLETFTILKEYNETELMYNASLKRWEAHKSLDLSASEDAKVMAIADGKVTQVYTNYLEGTVVVIEHSDGMKSLYGSLKEDVSVAVGDEVKQGQVIGKVGATANAEHLDTNHLHFELFRDGAKVDPSEYIPFTDK